MVTFDVPSQRLSEQQAITEAQALPNQKMKDAATRRIPIRHSCMRARARFAA